MPGWTPGETLKIFMKLTPFFMGLLYVLGVASGLALVVCVGTALLLEGSLISYILLTAGWWVYIVVLRKMLYGN